METNHRISIRNNSLVLDEMYFRIDEIRFVDVVRQEAPLVRKIGGAGGFCCMLLALICSGFGVAGVAAFFWFCAVLGLIAVLVIKRPYALRIGSAFGTTKAIISNDSAELQELRRRIIEALEHKDEDKNP